MELLRWFGLAVIVVLNVMEVRGGGRERRVDGPEEVVMDAHGKEDRAADEKDGQPPI